MSNPWESFVELVTKNPAVEFMNDHFGQWLLALLILVVGYPTIKVINRYLVKLFDKVDLDETVEMFIQRALSVFLWLVLITLVLDNLGIDITGFVAAFGIVGLAIAFAAQETISNFFSGIFLMLDRPFDVGDTILLDEKERADVLDVGLRSCRLYDRRLNTLVVMPNNRIANSKITNLT